MTADTQAPPEPSDGQPEGLLLTVEEAARRCGSLYRLHFLRPHRRSRPYSASAISWTLTWPATSWPLRPAPAGRHGDRDHLNSCPHLTRRPRPRTAAQHQGCASLAPNAASRPGTPAIAGRTPRSETATPA